MKQTLFCCASVLYNCTEDFETRQEQPSCHFTLSHGILLLLSCFNVICALLKYRGMAQWYAFVQYKPCLARKSASVMGQPCNNSPTGALILTGNLLLCVLKWKVNNQMLLSLYSYPVHKIILLSFGGIGGGGTIGSPIFCFVWETATYSTLHSSYSAAKKYCLG